MFLILGLGLASLPTFLTGIIGLLGLFASFHLANSKTYEALNDDIEIKRIMIFAFYLFPPMSMALGEMEAEIRIQSHIREVRWVGSREHQEVIGTIYFGKLGDMFVFIDKEEKYKFLIPSSELEGFSFTQKAKLVEK